MRLSGGFIWGFSASDERECAVRSRGPHAGMTVLGPFDTASGPRTEDRLTVSAGLAGGGGDVACVPTLAPSGASSPQPPIRNNPKRQAFARRFSAARV